MIFTQRVLSGFWLSSLWLTASVAAVIPDVKMVPAPPAKVPMSPIHVPADKHRLMAELIQQHVQWLEARISEAVTKRHAAEPWLPEARTFISESARFFNWHATRDPITAAWEKPAKALLETAERLGSLDPLLLLLQANLEGRARKWSAERLEHFVAQFPALLADDNPPAVKLMAAAWLWHVAEDRTLSDSATKVIQNCTDQLPSLFAASLAGATPQDADAVYMTIRYGYGSRYLEAHSEKMTPVLQQASGPGWLRDTLLGQAEIKTAWQGRGDSWAANVTDKGWKIFDEHMKLARDHLVKAWKAGPAVPWAASQMITATMAGYGEEGADERTWFDRAVTAAFDVDDAYDNLIWAYRPRWGGSHEKMLAFGAACAATGRYDTHVPSRLFKIIKDVSSEMPDRSAVYQDPDLCLQIVKLQQSMLQTAKTEVETHYYRSFLVANAFLARDYATAREQYALLKKPIHWEADSRLKEFGQLSFLWGGMIEAQDAPEAFTTLQKAEDAYREHRLPEARSLYQELLKSPTLAERNKTLKLARIRLAAIAVELRLAKGDWVRLADNERKLLWQPDWGSGWWNYAEGELSYRAEKAGELGRIIMNARIGREFEVRARLDNSAELSHPQVGVVVGHFWGSGTYVTAVCGQTGPDPKSTGAALVERAYDVPSHQQALPASLKPGSSIRVQVTKDTLTLWVDDQKVLDTVSIPSVLSLPGMWTQVDPRRCHFGFGSNYFPKGESWIKGIEFRRMDVPQ